MIIKEPMDFGTMRAKLHEGMYTSLEQFEVFPLSFNCTNLLTLVKEVNLFYGIVLIISSILICYVCLFTERYISNIQQCNAFQCINHHILQRGML